MNFLTWSIKILALLMICYLDLRLLQETFDICEVSLFEKVKHPTQARHCRLQALDHTLKRAKNGKAPISICYLTQDSALIFYPYTNPYMPRLTCESQPLF